MVASHHLCRDCMHWRHHINPGAGQGRLNPPVKNGGLPFGPHIITLFFNLHIRVLHRHLPTGFSGKKKGSRITHNPLICLVAPEVRVTVPAEHLQAMMQ